MKTSVDPWWEAVQRPPEKGSATPQPLARTLEEVYEAHFDFIWRNARRLGVPESSADDVVQDVFMVVHRRMSDFDGRASMRSWIFGILTRVVHDYRRNHRRKSSRWVSLDQEGSSAGKPIAIGPTPVELTERAQRVQLLERLLGELDESQRTLLVLSELEEWTLKEIAEFFGSNINTIFSRLRVAKRAFDKVYAAWLASEGEAP